MKCSIIQSAQSRQTACSNEVMQGDLAKGPFTALWVEIRDIMRAVGALGMKGEVQGSGGTWTEAPGRLCG